MYASVLSTLITENVDRWLHHATIRTLQQGMGLPVRIHLAFVGSPNAGDIVGLNGTHVCALLGRERLGFHRALPHLGRKFVVLSASHELGEELCFAAVLQTVDTKLMHDSVP